MITNNMPPVQKEEQTIVKVEPALQRMRKQRKLMNISGVLFAIAALIMIALGIVSLWVDRRFLWLSVFYLFLIAFNIPSQFTVRRQRKFWETLEQRRQRAARGDSLLLAAEQPEVDAHALTLPITIGQRPRLSTFLIVPGGLIVAMFIFTLIFVEFFQHFSFVPGKPVPSQITPIIVITMAFLTLLLVGLSVFFMYMGARRQITLTEGGLIQLGLFGKVRSIPWRDARLFAIDGIPLAKKYSDASLFELSSAQEIIRWSWLRANTKRVIFFANPTVTPIEYEREMRGVLSVIGGKTGLPLYDLRKEV